ncbi:MAG: SDR family oxidoreductase [Jaaginema sp. PMC 1079.18]|nr:SDR family oxidoreductase [Jaaginema sp. PMC 1080.18]MEC4851358.1 SDR family oxidoreductase [Jaaginema sp. PMC 1079.18]MEC4865372.1 SDR family oxidoreductase [Jaaginema sp. PMC 1078.18]
MNQRIALVTGGSRGLGYEICRALSQQNIKVILTARNPEAGEKAASQLCQGGGEVTFYPLDITDLSQITALRETILTKYGRLDILVNNAGIYLDQHQNALSITPQQITQAINTDVCGTFAMCQAVIPIMRQQNYGRIVNISSRTSRLDQMNHQGLTYKIAKSSINVITIVLAQEVKEDNIAINAVNPGWLKTDMGGEIAALSPDAGTPGPVMLATLPDGGPSGCFFNGTELWPW